MHTTKTNASNTFLFLYLLNIKGNPLFCIIFTLHLLVFAISGAIGLAIGLVFAQNSRVMSQDSVVYTVLAVAGSLILLYFAAGGLSSAMLYRENPSDMLTKE